MIKAEDVAVDFDAAGAISSIAGISSALLAVSLAIALVIPPTVRDLVERSGRFSGRDATRKYGLMLKILMISVGFFVVASVVSLVGIFFPSTAIAAVAGGFTGAGVLTLVVAFAQFAPMYLKDG